MHATPFGMTRSWRCFSNHCMHPFSAPVTRDQQRAAPSSAQPVRWDPMLGTQKAPQLDSRDRRRASTLDGDVARLHSTGLAAAYLAGLMRMGHKATTVKRH